MGSSSCHCLRADGTFIGQYSDAPVFVELLDIPGGTDNLLYTILFGKRIGGHYVERVSVEGRHWGKEYGACHLDGIYLS